MQDSSTASAGQKRAIDSHLNAKEVAGVVEIAANEATPVGDEGSPWAILRPGRFLDLKKIIGKSDWVQGRKGITADLNGVYFVEISDFNKKNGLVQISTRPEAGKTDIGPARKYWVEEEILYPLLKGASDFKACYLKPKRELFVFVPNRGITKDKYQEAEKKINGTFTNAKKYFKYYEKWLRARSTWSKRMPNAPYYAIYNVGKYTFSAYKVVWAEQSGNFCAAVASSTQLPSGKRRTYIPDHKIFFVEFSDKNAAHYLCGLLNSDIVKEFVESHNVSIQVGDIFKHMNIPTYVKSDKNHKKLAELSIKAHAEHDPQEREKILHDITVLGEKIILSAK